MPLYCMTGYGVGGMGVCCIYVCDDTEHFLLFTICSILHSLASYIINALADLRLSPDSYTQICALADKIRDRLCYLPIEIQT